MARITKRMVNAQKRANAGYAQMYNKKMKEMRVPIMFRLGIMSNMALCECEETMDLFETLGIECDVTKAAFEMANLIRTAITEYIKLSYLNNEKNVFFYMDMCNHSYKDAEEYFKEMKECVVRFLTKIGSDAPERKAQVVMAQMLIQQNNYVYDRMRKVNFARHKIDIHDEFKVFSMHPLAEVWNKLSQKYADIPEAKASMDVFEIEGFREAHTKYYNYMMNENFINDECKSAAALNKEEMPELYENILKEEAEKNGINS